MEISPPESYHCNDESGDSDIMLNSTTQLMMIDSISTDSDALKVCKSDEVIDQMNIDQEMKSDETPSQYLDRAMIQSLMILQMEVFQAQVDLLNSFQTQSNDCLSETRQRQIEQIKREKKLQVSKTILNNTGDNFSMALVSILDAHGRVSIRSHVRYLILLMTRARKVTIFFLMLKSLRLLQ